MKKLANWIKTMRQYLTLVGTAQNVVREKGQWEYTEKYGNRLFARDLPALKKAIMGYGADDVKIKPLESSSESEYFEGQEEQKSVIVEEVFTEDEAKTYDSNSTSQPSQESSLGPAPSAAASSSSGNWEPTEEERKEIKAKWADRRKRAKQRRKEEEEEADESEAEEEEAEEVGEEEESEAEEVEAEEEYFDYLEDESEAEEVEQEFELKSTRDGGLIVKRGNLYRLFEGSSKQTMEGFREEEEKDNWKKQREEILYCRQELHTGVSRPPIYTRRAILGMLNRHIKRYPGLVNPTFDFGKNPPDGLNATKLQRRRTIESQRTATEEDKKMKQEECIVPVYMWGNMICRIKNMESYLDPTHVKAARIAVRQVNMERRATERRTSLVSQTTLQRGRQA